LKKSWMRVIITDKDHVMAKKLLEKAGFRSPSEFAQTIIERHLRFNGRQCKIITVEELITDDVFLLSNEEILEVLNRLRRAENALIEELSRRLRNAQTGRERQAFSLRGGDKV